MDPNEVTPTPIDPPYQPPRPFVASVQGWTSASPEQRYAGLSEDWPNTVTVEATVRWWPTEAVTSSRVEEGGYYADTVGPYGERQLVQIDTNYKPGRTGHHPVRLTRTDAIALAVHVLAAVEDTFHAFRCGGLRASEATAVLTGLEQLDYALGELRAHALGDLVEELADRAEQDIDTDTDTDVDVDVDVDTDTAGGGDDGAAGDA